MTTNEILSVAQSGQANVESIKAKFYNVVLEPARVSNPMFEQPKETYFVYNERSGKQIAKKSVGKDFTPMQQNEFLENILATIQEFGADLDLDSLTFRSYSSDSKIEFSIKTMHPLKFKNWANLNDQTNIELVFSTSYDGTKSNRISLFTHRLICKNGMTVKDLQGELKGRNTLGGKTKILSYAQEVAEIINGAEDFKKRMLELDSRKVTKAEVEAYKLKMFGYNDASLKAEYKAFIEATNDVKKADMKFRKATEILTSFNKAVNTEFPRSGQTAYGLLQATTFYTNHLANAKGKAHTNDEYIRFATGAKINDKAQDLIFAMV
jgi:hypothetical protein